MRGPGASFRGTADEEADIRRRRIAGNRLPMVLVPAIWIAIAAYLALGGLLPALAKLGIALAAGGAGGYVVERVLRPRKRMSRPGNRGSRNNGRPAVDYRFEIRPKGLLIERNGDRTIVAWADVKGVDDSGDDVVIQTRYDLAIIRSRAFTSAKARKAFVAAMRRLVERAAEGATDS